MRVVIKSKKVSLSASLRAYLEEKLVAPIRKLVQSMDEDLLLLEIEFSREPNHKKNGKVWRAEANLAIGKKIIRAVEEGETPNEVIDLVGEEISREIKSFKGKKKTKEIRGARSIKRMMKKPLA